MTRTAKISIAVISGLALSVLLIYFGWTYMARPVNLMSPVELAIEPGENLSAISAKLKAGGLINSLQAFKIRSDFFGLSKKYKAGNYSFSGKLSLEMLSNSLIEGDKIGNVMKFTIPEGWLAKEIDAYFVKINKFGPGDYLSAANDREYNNTLKTRYTFLADKPVGSGLEGYLFPDTYKIFRDAKVNEVIEKQLIDFDRRLKPEWRQEIKAQGKTIYEIVTMASIIEKEVRKVEDMKMVSDIFWRRTKNGQGLESCATLAYILGVNKAQYTLDDTKIDSPYNTYINKGLPPGPISNPGANAIEAAIYPQVNKYNFFLTASGTGETIYSVDFNEHVRNKNKYLK
jgi:UPF0755 protein